MKSILLDTNAYAAFKRENSDAVEIINGAECIAINVIVLGELLAGFRLGTQLDSNLAELREFLSESGVYVLAIDAATADGYGHIFEKLQMAGKPIPTNDMWIAAAAIQNNLTLFTCDGHFSHLTGLSIGRSPRDFS